MAIAAPSKDYSASEFGFSSNAKTAVFYIVIAIVAMSIAVPAGLMTGNVGVFDECSGEAACAAATE